jgi:exosortase/archaeosortase family protein
LLRQLKYGYFVSLNHNSFEHNTDSRMKFGLNKEIAAFLLKLLGFFGVWYFLYELWLLPDGRLDEWLSVNLIDVSGGILSLLNVDFFMRHRVIGLDGTAGLMIVDGCNGLEAIGLFIGFVIAYPGDNIKRALFIPAGILAIYLVNVARIFTLIILQAHYPQWFDFAHDYSTSAIFYLAIFLMWVVWMNYGDKPAPKVSVPAES